MIDALFLFATVIQRKENVFLVWPVTYGVACNSLCWIMYHKCRISMLSKEQRIYFGSACKML